MASTKPKSTKAKAKSARARPKPTNPATTTASTPSTDPPPKAPRITGLKSPQELTDFRNLQAKLLKFACEKWKESTGGTFQGLVIDSVVGWTAMFAWFRGETTPSLYSLYRLSEKIGARVIFDSDGMAIEDEYGDWMADEDGVWTKDEVRGEWVLSEKWEER